jgi:hypothetical protein
MERVESCEQHQKEFLKRGRSLLVVVSSPPNETRYSNFTNQVAEYNKKEPFNFTMPSILQKDGFHKVSYTCMFLSEHFAYKWKFGICIYCKSITGHVCGM